MNELYFLPKWIKKKREEKTKIKYAKKAQVEMRKLKRDAKDQKRSSIQAAKQTSL